MLDTRQGRFMSRKRNELMQDILVLSIDQKINFANRELLSWIRNFNAICTHTHRIYFIPRSHRHATLHAGKVTVSVKADTQRPSTLQAVVSALERCSFAF